jgi:kynurenine formamidase
MRPEPTEAEVKASLFQRTNWGRWGENDELGAINLINPAKRLEAVACVRSGVSLTLSRPLAKTASPNDDHPAQHYMQFWYDGGQGPTPPERFDVARGGWAADYYGVFFHGYSTTHLDAISHVWDINGMYNGRDPREHLQPDGATFGGVEHWGSDLVTRGVLVDIPKFRGVDFVTREAPVHGFELEQALAQQGTTVSAGDALCVYMGREDWDTAHSLAPYGTPGTSRPGMHASTLTFLRDNDIAILGWDMMDAHPYPYDVAWSIHGAVWAYGMALVDNMLLKQLAVACTERDAYDFLLMVGPLLMTGGTGSPVNPLALL